MNDPTTAKHIASIARLSSHYMNLLSSSDEIGQIRDSRDDITEQTLARHTNL